MNEKEVIRQINEEGKEPRWGSIGNGDEYDICVTCDGICVWPPTGEPASSICVQGCHTRISEAWESYKKKKIASVFKEIRINERTRKNT